jgi:hypothetical protein
MDALKRRELTSTEISWQITYRRSCSVREGAETQAKVDLLNVAWMI